VIRSTIYSGSPARQGRHQAEIQGTPPFTATTGGDGAAVRVRCGVVPLVVTSTGLRSAGGSLSQGLFLFGLVSSLVSLISHHAVRYAVAACSSAVGLADFLRLVLGAVIWGVPVGSAYTVLTKTSRLRGVRVALVCAAIIL